MNGGFKVDLGVTGENTGLNEEVKGCRNKELTENLHENIRVAQEMTTKFFEEIEEFTLFFDNFHKVVDRKAECGFEGELKNIGKQVKASIKGIEKHKGSGKELLRILKSALEGKLNINRKVKAKVDANDVKKFCFVYTCVRSQINGFSRIISLSVFDKNMEEVCIGDRFPNNSLSCRVSDKLVFLYIGQFGIKSLLINLDESIKEPQLRKESVGRSLFNQYQSAFVLFNEDKIGFFGAEGVKNEFFDLVSKNWFPLPDLPHQVNQPSACSLKSKVYIVDQVQASLIIFSVKSLTYKILSLNSLEPNTQKLIFSIENKIYLLQAKTLLTFDSSSKEFTTFKKFTNIRSFKKIISFPLLYDFKVYFLTNYRKVLTLSLNI